MANYYTEFSFQVICKSQEEKDFLLHWSDEPTEEESGRGNLYDEWKNNCYGVVVEDMQGGYPFYVWVHDGESGSPENAALMISKYQEKFETHEPVSFKFAQTCYKPRLDAFGGGGVIIYKGEQYWSPSANEWVDNKLKELEK